MSSSIGRITGWVPARTGRTRWGLICSCVLRPGTGLQSTGINGADVLDGNYYLNVPVHGHELKKFSGKRPNLDMV